jgi:hypothetical protein
MLDFAFSSLEPNISLIVQYVILLDKVNTQCMILSESDINSRKLKIK